MKTIALFVALWALVAAAHADKIAPTGPVKAYKGPEGQIVAMLEISDGKELLVHFRNLDTDLDGKTLRYRISDQGDGDKEIYVDKKRGSKTYRSILLVLHAGGWTFHHPSRHDVSFGLSYSEDQSQKIKPDEIIHALAP